MEIKGIILNKKNLYSQSIQKNNANSLSNLSTPFVSQKPLLAQKDKMTGDLLHFLETFFRERGLPVDFEKLQRILLSINKDLKIEIDESLRTPIYKIIDILSKEVLKQIPLEDVVDFKRALYEFLKEYLEDRASLKGLFLEREV